MIDRIGHIIHRRGNARSGATPNNLMGLPGAEEAKHDNGKKLSTSVLVPTDEPVAQYLWPLYMKSRKQVHDITPEAGAGESEGQSNEQTNEDPNISTSAVVHNFVVEKRVKVLSVMETGGKSLVECSSSWELCESIAHRLFGGFHTFKLEV